MQMVSPTNNFSHHYHSVYWYLSSKHVICGQGEYVDRPLPKSSSFVSYQDAALGIKFQYLENWMKIIHYSANNSRIEFISPLQSQLEIFPPSFLVGVSKSTSKLTLDGLSKTIPNKARESMMDFNLLQ
jgi:hypothetical protein